MILTILKSQHERNGFNMQISVSSSAYLVTEGMSANDDWMSPAGNQTRNLFAENWFPEDCATEDVSDGTVGTQPHLL